MYTDRIYAPAKRRWQMLIPGPWGHWAKVAFEKWFLWQARTGRLGKGAKARREKVSPCRRPEGWSSRGRRPAADFSVLPD